MPPTRNKPGRRPSARPQAAARDAAGRNAMGHDTPRSRPAKQTGRKGATQMEAPRAGASGPDSRTPRARPSGGRGMGRAGAQSRPDHARTEQHGAERGHADQRRAGPNRAGQSRPDHARTEQHGAERSHADQRRSSPNRTGQSRPDHARTEQYGAERGHADQRRAGPNRAAQSRPDHARAEQYGAERGHADQRRSSPNRAGSGRSGQTRFGQTQGRHDRPARGTDKRRGAVPEMQEAPPPRPVPSEPLPVLYEDRHVVIVNKPAGLPVHTGPGGGPCVEDWFPLLSRRADGPWLAHRLDADTAGCLAIALRKQPLLAMQEAFARHTARKTYWAIVRNGPTEQSGRIDLPLVRENSPSGWHMRPDTKNAAKNAATTLWRVLGRSHDLCWLELTLLSGRTHQARVHCAAMGWPIVGDSLYGKPHANGLHLLARSLSLPLDPTVTATAPPPPPMQAALLACGWQPAES